VKVCGMPPRNSSPSATTENLKSLKCQHFDGSSVGLWFTGTTVTNRKFSTKQPYFVLKNTLKPCQLKENSIFEVITEENMILSKRKNKKI
jgi:hypothetical protein